MCTIQSGPVLQGTSTRVKINIESGPVKAARSGKSYRNVLQKLNLLYGIILLNSDNINCRII